MTSTQLRARRLPRRVRADLEAVERTVRRVYENANELAEDGLVDFEALDLRPALRVLDGLLGEPRR